MVYNIKKKIEIGVIKGETLIMLSFAVRLRFKCSLWIYNNNCDVYVYRL